MLRLAPSEHPDPPRRPDLRTGRVDEALDLALERARGGEEDGFVELWRTLHPALLRYLTVRGNDSPEDLASEAWFQVVRDLPRFQGDAQAFRAFLFTVARNRAIDQGRTRTARPLVLVPEPVENGSVVSAEDDVLELDATRSALALVATLPPVQAEMVMLRVVAGLDVADVARIVGKQPGTVRVSVHRALKALARSYAVQDQAEQQEEVAERG